jgi:hypothetical protein
MSEASGTIDRVNSETEVKRAVIRVLTAMSIPEVGSEEDRDQLVEAALGEGFFKQQAITLSVPTGARGTPDLQALAELAARQAVEHVGRQAFAAVTYLMTLFHMLAAECPGVDVEAFLRLRAMEVAAEDEGAG